ncbi:MAG: efflux RND transporter permease subunit, partial [Nitrospirae bacterium]|nr:efflux RND transporter permease subunit [Nitrospirota bacterium]
MISHFFIDRPIFASVLSVVIVVLGLVSLQGLPIAQFPEITPPVIQIDADYPGASAEVIADSVARPIEVQLPGIDNLLYYDSTSTNDGHMTIKLTFEIGTNVDIAQVQTQNRQKLAESQLPPEVLRQGISVKKVSPDLLAVVALSSSDPTKDTVFVSNYALLNVIDNLKRLRGVGDAVVFGGQNYSMRLILDPTRMAQLSLTPTDIATVVREQNRDFPAGTIGREPAPKGTELTIPVITQGRLTDVKDFEEMIVRALPDGSMIRLKDVAKIELGAQSYSLEGRWNGKPNVFLLTFLSPGANALDTVKRVRKEMDRVSKSFPQGVSYDIPYDTTKFIEVSIKEVVKTLAQAMVLVILVVYLFLQSWRATLIPGVAVPVSLIGTFAGMQALGFSINTLTLFGMVLAIGMVVDDAIVVVENVERIMSEEGLPPREATAKSMDQITPALIGIGVVLAAVFGPMAFFGGSTGVIYRQFSITIASAMLLSVLVALILTPVLCATMLRPVHKGHQPAESAIWFLRPFFLAFDRVFFRFRDGYVQWVGHALARRVRYVLAFVVIVAGLAFLFTRMG